jgi:superfamily II DNA or RNA helicase
MTELRSYQIEVIADLERAIATGRKRLILVMPTGAGKTVVAANIINKAVSEQKRVLVLAWILEPSATELYVNRICTSLPSSLRIA